MIKTIISFFLNSLGYKIERFSFRKILPDMDAGFNEILKQCSPYTMTSLERMYALYEAAKYVIKAGVHGAFVETGVWKGGSAMIAASTFKKFGDISRDIYLYDTFEGMPEPKDNDVMIANNFPAKKIWEKFKNKHKEEKWMCYAPLEEVEKNLLKTDYSREKFIFVKGRVEDTIPSKIPEQIAILRIDTDWYDSTYHALKHLFPRLLPQGVLILDDYGHWKGAREAADQYFKEEKISMFLSRIDGAGRIGIKNK